MVNDNQESNIIRTSVYLVENYPIVMTGLVAGFTWFVGYVVFY